MTPSFSHPRMAALSIALGAAFPALAQTSAPASELRETVVTANRSEQLLTDALPHTTVIGRDAIERSQAVDLASLLAGEAGFQSVQNGGRGSATSLFLRGSAATQVLVMIDGVPLTRQDTTGTVSLEHIMLDSIERVEIVRGNVSAIYGSGAVGGVIQLFTRKGQGKPAGYAQLEAGSFNTVRAAAGVGGQVGDTRFALGIGGHRTTGISAIDVAQHPGENPDLDGYRNVNVNLSVSHLLAPGQTIGFRAQGTQGRFDTDGGGWGSATDVYKGSSALGNGSLYSHNQITADWRSELTYSQGREKSMYDATFTAYPYDSQSTSRSRTLNWTNTVALGAWTALDIRVLRPGAGPGEDMTTDRRCRATASVHRYVRQLCDHAQHLARRDRAVCRRLRNERPARPAAERAQRRRQWHGLADHRLRGIRLPAHARMEAHRHRVVGVQPAAAGLPLRPVLGQPAAAARDRALR